jgi:hypothetical protein
VIEKLNLILGGKFKKLHIHFTYKATSYKFTQIVSQIRSGSHPMTSLFDPDLDTLIELAQKKAIDSNFIK